MLYLQKFEFWQHLCHYEVCIVQYEKTYTNI